MERENLASELLHEIKAQSKRWFIAFCVMVVLEIATIVGFMWYITLPIEEITVTQESSDESSNQFVEGDYSNVSETNCQ